MHPTLDLSQSRTSIRFRCLKINTAKKLERMAFINNPRLFSSFRRELLTISLLKLHNLLILTSISYSKSLLIYIFMGLFHHQNWGFGVLGRTLKHIILILKMIGTKKLQTIHLLLKNTKRVRGTIMVMVNHILLMVMTERQRYSNLGLMVHMLDTKCNQIQIL